MQLPDVARGDDLMLNKTCLNPRRTCEQSFKCESTAHKNKGVCSSHRRRMRCSNWCLSGAAQSALGVRVRRRFASSLAHLDRAFPTRLRHVTESVSQSAAELIKPAFPPESGGFLSSTPQTTTHTSQDIYRNHGCLLDHFGSLSVASVRHHYQH